MRVSFTIDIHAFVNLHVQLEIRLRTLFWTMKPVMTGLTIPGIVATVLDIPIIRLAY